MATAKTCKQRVDIAKKHGNKVTNAAVALEKCLVKGGSCKDEESNYDYHMEHFMIFVGHVNTTCSGGIEALDLVTNQSLKDAMARVKINPSNENIESVEVLRAMKRNVAKKRR